jgi:hypothetical protein
MLFHSLVTFGVTLAFGLLVLGWRDRERVEIGDHLAALLSMLAGILFGVVWEIAEFLIDWIFQTDLQTSNTDTMVDLLWTDVGAVVAAVLATRVYCHVLTASQRTALGARAHRLVDGPSRMLDRHGKLITLVVVVLSGAAVASLWYTGRTT